MVLGSLPACVTDTLATDLTQSTNIMSFSSFAVSVGRAHPPFPSNPALAIRVQTMSGGLGDFFLGLASGLLFPDPAIIAVPCPVSSPDAKCSSGSLSDTVPSG